PLPVKEPHRERAALDELPQAIRADAGRAKDVKRLRQNGRRGNDRFTDSLQDMAAAVVLVVARVEEGDQRRSEEHTSELQSPTTPPFPYQTLFRSTAAGQGTTPRARRTRRTPSGDPSRCRAGQGCETPPSERASW